MSNAALGELHFEGVFRLRVSIAKGCFGGAMKGCFIDSAMQKSGFGFMGAPGFCADSAERNADEAELAARDLGDDGRRGEGKLV